MQMYNILGQSGDLFGNYCYFCLVVIDVSLFGIATPRALKPITNRH